MGLSDLILGQSFFGLPQNSSGARTATNLNSAYVHLTSGAGVGIRMSCKYAEAINEVYFFNDAFTGTAANVTLRVRLYNSNSTNKSRPGSTLLATASTVTLSTTADKWVKAEFDTPYTPAIGEVVWFVIDNTASVPATDYPGILVATNAIFPALTGVNFGRIFAYTTASGFSTDGSVATEMPFVVKQGTARYTGQPFTQGVVYFSVTTLERGIVFTPPFSFSCCAIEWGSSTADDAIVFTDAATAPGGATLRLLDVDNVNEYTGAISFAPFVFEAGKSYRVTTRKSGSTGGPGCLQIEDYSSYSAVFDAVRESSPFFVPYGCIDDGAGGWTLLKDVCPHIQGFFDEVFLPNGAFAFIG